MIHLHLECASITANIMLNIVLNSHFCGPPSPLHCVFRCMGQICPSLYAQGLAKYPIQNRCLICVGQTNERENEYMITCMDYLQGLDQVPALPGRLLCLYQQNGRSPPMTYLFAQILPPSCCDCHIGGSMSYSPLSSHYYYYYYYY